MVAGGMAREPPVPLGGDLLSHLPLSPVVQFVQPGLCLLLVLEGSFTSTDHPH